jgi:hypothetical protein
MYTINARAADSNIILFAICIVRNAVSDLESGNIS